MIIELLRNVVIGLAVAMPLGPVGLICIRRTLRQGWVVGLFAGMGAAFADMLCAVIAGTGMAQAIPFLTQRCSWLQFIIGLIMLAFGVYVFRKAPIQCEVDFKVSGLIKAFSATFAITAANPGTILGFSFIFLTIKMQKVYGAHEILILAVGIFLGSMLWWLTLIISVVRYRRALSLEQQRLINHISGIIIIVFSLALLGEFFMKWFRII